MIMVHIDGTKYSVKTNVFNEMFYVIIFEIYTIFLQYKQLTFNMMSGWFCRIGNWLLQFSCSWNYVCESNQSISICANVVTKSYGEDLSSLSFPHLNLAFKLMFLWFRLEFGHSWLIFSHFINTVKWVNG